MGKKDDDDEDEDDDGAPPRDSHTPPEQHGLMPHHMQHQAFQHVRHVTPSASPPISNGFQHRGPSPQPPHHLSRPNSRLDQHPGHVRRSSNLAPPQPYPSQAPPPQPSYAYMPNPPFYNPQAAQRPQGPPGPQYHYATHPMPNPQVQQYMQQEQRRQSMPPVPQMQPSPQMQPTAQMQPHPSQHQQQQQHQQHQQQQIQQQQAQQQSQQQQQQQSQTPQPQPQQQHERPPQPTITVPSPPPPQHDFQSPPLPQPKPLHASAKHSIFTPIDDSQSMLAAHWGSSSMVPPRSDVQAIKQESRSQSIDVAAVSRLQPNGTQSLQAPKISSPQPPPQPPQRTQSTSSVPTITPSTRTNSLQMDKNKPKLRVQIPSEHSDGGSATADSSPKDSISGATPARSTDASHSSGVVLPPPSPSANSLLSAGATGPPNPFARPPPPTNSNSYGSSSRDMETPISALPSRFVENGLLPSPSSFYPEWGFGRGDSNMLPSPLTFQTPVVVNGPSFARDDSADRKRKTSDGGSDTSQKRAKT